MEDNQNERLVRIKRLNSYRNTQEEGMKDGVIKYTNGRYLTVTDLEYSAINLDFIAMSLAKQPRYNGHTGDMTRRNHGHYSIAQHSVKMAEASLFVYGDPVLAMQCLLHDAGECYTGDITNPLKVLIKDKISQIENKIDEKIFKAFNIPYPMDERVKQIDVNICDWEMSVMLDMNTKSYGYNNYWSVEESYENFRNTFFQILEFINLQKFENLTGGFSHKRKS